MSSNTFTALEESVSFYTRNDFAILNHYLTGNLDGLWKYARIAYQDNQGILNEFRTGVRKIQSDYDIKWINSLKKRIIRELDDCTKRSIVETAKKDISILLNAMEPAKRDLRLYRTAWIDGQRTLEDHFPYSREYPSLAFAPGSVLEINIISAFSLTPYREDDNVGSDHYRYELHVPQGSPILELDRFVTHNENGEVLIPPMSCRVAAIDNTGYQRRKGVVTLEYEGPLSVI